jgi:hypothetical protein
MSIMANALSNEASPPRQAQLAAVRVRIADGPVVYRRGQANQHLPGDELWSVSTARPVSTSTTYLTCRPSRR